MESRRSIVFVGSCLFLAVAVSIADDAPPVPPPPANAVPLAVRGINDGASVILPDRAGDRTVALAGVARPEDKLALERLRAFLEQLLLGEKVACVVQLPPSDAEGAAANPDVVTGHLYRMPDGLYVNLEVIRQAYAAVGEKDAGERLSLFRHYEKTAREQHKGVWAPRSSTLDPAAPAATPAKIPAPTVDQPQTADAGDAAPQTGDKAGAANRVDLKAITVYITKSGKKYHRQDCQHVRKSAQAISLEEALKKGYEPCKRCNPQTKEKPTPMKWPAPSYVSR